MRRNEPSLQRRRVAVIFLSILAVLLFDTASDLEHIHQIVSRLARQEIDEPWRPGSGEHVLPSEVRVMLALLRKAEADSFRFSPGIASQGLIMQRLVEGAYPLAAGDYAHHYLYVDHEPLPPACRPVMAQKGIALAYCP